MPNCPSEPAEPAPAGLVVSLHIVNQYELHPTVEVTITDTTIAACPIDHLPRNDDEAVAFHGLPTATTAHKGASGAKPPTGAYPPRPGTLGESPIRPG